MSKPNYFSITPAKVRYSKELTANEKLLFGEITALSNKNGYCTASNGYFSELYEVTKRSISRYVSNLAKLGFVHVEEERKGKQITGRKIYPIMDVRGYRQNCPPYRQNCPGGIDKNVVGGIDKIVYHNNTSKNNTSKNIKENPKEKILDSMAESLYQAYPRHTGHGAAIKKITKALKDVSESRPDAYGFLMDRVEAFARSPDGRAGQYTPHPATWFNQERYYDDEQEWYKREDNNEKRIDAHGIINDTDDIFND